MTRPLNRHSYLFKPHPSFLEPCHHSAQMPIRPCDRPASSSKMWVPDRPSCTTALVVSVANPLSGPFKLSQIDRGTVVVQAVDLLDTLAALDFDNRVFGRAMKQLSITLPDNFSPSDEDVILSGAISGELILLPGTTSTSWWHFFTSLPSLELVSNEYIVVSTGQRVRIFVGATITVKFSNGYTAKYKLVNIHSSIQWQLVPGSLRDQDGNEPNAAPASAPTGERRSDAAATVPDPMAQSNITLIAPYMDRRGFVSIEAVSGAGVGYPTTYIRVH